MQHDVVQQAFKKLTQLFFMRPMSSTRVKVSKPHKMEMKEWVFTHYGTNHFANLPCKPLLSRHELKSFDVVNVPDFYATNPSIVQDVNDHNTYWGIIRMVNYHLYGPTETRIPSKFNGKSITIPILVKYYLVNNTFVKQKQWRLDDIKSFPILSEAFIGLEDIRLFSFSNQIWFNGVYCQANKQGTPEMMVGVVNLPNATDEVFRINCLGCCRVNANVQRAEKNWLFLRGEQTHLDFIYSINQGTMTIARVSIIGGMRIQQWPAVHLIKLQTNTVPSLLELRGSAAPVAIPNQSTTLTQSHRLMATHFRSGQRQYWHVFLVLDENDCVVKMSEPIVFLKLHVEFVMSVVFIDHDQFIVTLGVNDNIAAYCVLKVSKLFGQQSF